MPRSKKTGAAAVQENAMGVGHNNDELVKSIMERFAAEEQIIIEAKGRQKEVLREGKASGILKTAIRKAYKDLTMTDEQRQANKEVEDARKSYAAICREVGLFVPEEEAA